METENYNPDAENEIIDQTTHEKFGLSEFWFMRDDETSNLINAIESQRVSLKELNEICELLDRKLNIANIPDVKERTPSQVMVRDHLEEVSKKMNSYKEVLRTQKLRREEPGTIHEIDYSESERDS